MLIIRNHAKGDEMGLFETDKEKIRSVLLNEEFLDFMFEMLIGDKVDANGTLWREVYKHEIVGPYDRLIKIIDTHISHKVPISEGVITSFILTEIVDGLCSGMCMCSRIKFHAVCILLYRKLFYILEPYYIEIVK